MANKKFQNNQPISWSCSYNGRSLTLKITETVNESANSSTLNWTLTSDGGSAAYYTIAPTTITINGTQVYYKARTGYTTHVFPAAKGSTSGSIVIKHNANGTKTNVYVSFKTNVYYESAKECAGENVDLTTIQTYGLTIKNTSNVSGITVNRTSSGYGGTGNLSGTSILYYGDKLKITATANTGYKIENIDVNGTKISSGSTYTVQKKDVTVSAQVSALASTVSATDATIGSQASTITIKRNSTAYYHSLSYKFGTASGFITSSGSPANPPNAESKFQTEKIQFSPPAASFYEAIKNAKSGTCTITCKTYSSANSTTAIGTSTCSITINTLLNLCKPIVSGSVVDTNATTIKLTGNSSRLIKYKSNALCTITAEPKNSASISSRYINAVAPNAQGIRTISNVSVSEFKFSATDSRGYTAESTVQPTVVAYENLTCNPVITRPSPTGSSMVMNISGIVFRGFFDAGKKNENTLTIKYRYKESAGSTQSDWVTVSDIRYNAESGVTSYSVNNIVIGNDFDYQKSYIFTIQATDGANGTVLTTVNKEVTVNRGTPVFDWGENDFNINAILNLNNTNILNIIYPVGSIYMHSSSTIPAVVSNIGKWTSVSTGISNVYAWKRDS